MSGMPLPFYLQLQLQLQLQWQSTNTRGDSVDCGRFFEKIGLQTAKNWNQLRSRSGPRISYSGQYRQQDACYIFQLLSNG